MRTNEITALPKLNFNKGGSIDLRACRSGLSGQSVAEAFARSQGVDASGMRGYADFSTDANSFSAIDSTSQNVYLNVYDRGWNTPLLPHGVEVLTGSPGYGGGNVREPRIFPAGANP